MRSCASSGTGEGDGGECSRMVMATISLCGDMIALLGDSGSVDIARKTAPPSSRRWRLRVKLSSVLGSGLRRGGEGEAKVGGSSVADDCSML
jgi:hypothetical protein